MIKKLGTILCLSSSLFAVSAAQADWEDNLLVGVSGGYANRDGILGVNYGHPAPARLVTIFNQGLEENELIWGLLAGYQARCNGWLLGAELNADWRNLNETNNFSFVDALGTTWNATSNYDQDIVWGLSFRLGYEVNPCFLPYLRVGGETSNDKLTYRAANPTLAVINEGSRRQYRFVAGVGAEMPVPALFGLSFRLEYNYCTKGKGVDANGYASDNLTFISTAARVKTNIGKAELVYNFM